MADTFPNIHDPATGPADLVNDLTAIFTDAITNHPRSLQKRIGPSEIGHPCDRQLGYHFAKAPKVNISDRLPWKSTIGTAMHTWAEETLARWIITQNDTATLGPRFLLETKVDVGAINGEDIDGSCDLYDRKTATVIDYKFVGGTQLRGYKANGPGQKYRIQAHAYGRGWIAKGYPVEHVAVWFLPRDQEFKQHHFWSEPYDEQIVLDALARADRIAQMAEALGPAAAPLMKTSDQVNCTYCPWFKPGSTDLTTACGGDPAAMSATSPSLQSLIA
jgi:hypothetical protein